MYMYITHSLITHTHMYTYAQFKKKDHEQEETEFCKDSTLYLVRHILSPAEKQKLIVQKKLEISKNLNSGKNKTEDNHNLVVL